MKKLKTFLCAVFVSLGCITTVNAADTKVTGAQALSSSQLAISDSPGAHTRSVYADTPRENSSAGAVSFIEGTCYPGGQGGRNTCHIASGKEWYCSMSGGRAIGEGERARVYLSGNNWYAYISRGGWPGELTWSCYKKT